MPNTEPEYPIDTDPIIPPTTPAIPPDLPPVPQQVLPQVGTWIKLLQGGLYYAVFGNSDYRRIYHVSSPILIDGCMLVREGEQNPTFSYASMPFEVVSEEEKQIIFEALAEAGLEYYPSTYSIIAGPSRRLPQGSTYYYVSGGQLLSAQDDLTSVHTDRFNIGNYHYTADSYIITLMLETPEANWNQISRYRGDTQFSMGTINLSKNYGMLL